jgi:hypothetical protein
VLSFDAVEEVCESRHTTLVIHPAIRRALKGYEESFYVGLRCFLAGDSDGLYFLPLQGELAMYASSSRSGFHPEGTIFSGLTC